MSKNNFIGGSPDLPATSPSQIILQNPSSPEGPYWYTNGTNVYQSYTRFNWHESSHWLLILKVHNRSDIPSGSALWTNNNIQNQSDFNLTSGVWSKYESYLYYSFTRVLMQMNTVIPAIMGFNTARTMVSAMNVNGISNGDGIAWDTTNPSLGITNLRYDSPSFYFSGGPFAAQVGSETIVQKYGINTWGNNASNGNPDNAGLVSAGTAGARVGCPLDEGGNTTQKTTNSGSDSGFGFGGGAGNPARTWSCGYGEWSNANVVNTLPGYLWVR
jgi:hypothetical protein